MALTDTQIERYSRQIVVPGIGGRAQERLLASCTTVVAAPAEAAAALAYLAGAGVGKVVLYPVGDEAPYRALIERTRDLNPEVSVAMAPDASDASTDRSSDASGLMLALIGDTRTADAAARLAREHRYAGAIVARLDAPGRIALLPAPPPPCPRCADADLLSPPGERAANAGAIAMVAVAEAFKLLAGMAGQRPEAQMIEFHGYASGVRALGCRPSGGAPARCACATLS